MIIDANRLFSHTTTISDLLYAAIALFIIIGLIAFTRLLNKVPSWQEEWSRKFVHIVIGVMAAFAPFYFDSPHLLLFTAFLFGIIDFITIRKGYLKGIHGHRFSYGTVYFPLSYFILIVFCWPEQKYLITIGVLLFAIPDALAAIIGQAYSSGIVFTPIRDKKSLLGSATMFIGTFAILLPFCLIYLDKSIYMVLLLTLLMAFIITIVEMLSSLGSDNFFVPISGALSFYIFQHANDVILTQLVFGTFLSLIVAAISIKFRFLSLSGSLITFLLATSIFGLGGLKWAMAILSFFILSSLLSKAGKGAKEKFKDTFEKSGVRDYAQVLANGGIAGILVIYNFFYSSEVVYHLYLISLSVATADTWATEIGILFKWKPRLITTLKKVDPGISGAVSIHGTLGGFLGSLIIVASGLIFCVGFDIRLLLFISIFGMIGSLADSILGTTIQGQYKCSVCQKFTEKKIHCNHDSIHISGIKYISNDVVNLLSSIITLIIFLSI